jgi:hypothetical protein
MPDVRVDRMETSMLTRDDWHGSPRLFRPAVIYGGSLQTQAIRDSV